MKKQVAKRVRFRCDYSMTTLYTFWTHTAAQNCLDLALHPLSCASLLILFPACPSPTTPPPPTSPYPIPACLTLTSAITFLTTATPLSPLLIYAEGHHTCLLPNVHIPFTPPPLHPLSLGNTPECCCESSLPSPFLQSLGPLDPAPLFPQH